jgi:hypothetical protein
VYNGYCCCLQHSLHGIREMFRSFLLSLTSVGLCCMLCQIDADGQPAKFKSIVKPDLPTPTIPPGCAKQLTCVGPVALVFSRRRSGTLCCRFRDTACYKALDECLNEDGVPENIDAVCMCYQGYSKCYDDAQCFGLVPTAMYNYCFNVLMCPKTFCEGSGGSHVWSPPSHVLSFVLPFTLAMYFAVSRYA